MTNVQLNENELWLLSFYRHSEIQGALFFGKVAQTIPDGEIQCDITRHFADESQHARYWTNCITQLGYMPLKLNNGYQDKYFKAAGVPHIHPVIEETLKKIMEDEKWHLSWVDQALKEMESQYGQEKIATTIKKYRHADQIVFEETMREHEDRIQAIISSVN
jgi:rubrerythrin